VAGKRPLAADGMRLADESDCQSATGPTGRRRNSRLATCATSRFMTPFAGLSAIGLDEKAIAKQAAALNESQSRLRPGLSAGRIARRPNHRHRAVAHGRSRG